MTAFGRSLLYTCRRTASVKAFTTDGRDIECDAVEEGTFGVYLLDGDDQIGHIPYDNLSYVLEVRSPVASSAIETVDYNDEENVLEIEFRHGGVYRYFDVPEDIFRDLLTAGSRGRYFQDHVRGEYNYRRLRQMGGRQL